SIGEVGFDWEFLSVQDPLTTFDLMSYCPPKWISPYFYQGAFNALTPLPNEPRRPGYRREDYIDVSFLPFPPERWIVIELTGCPRPWRSGPPIPKSDLEVQLFDADGAVIFRGPAPTGPWETGGKGEAAIVHTVVPWRKDASAIVLCRGPQVLARSQFLPAPKLEVKFPSASEIEAGTGAVLFPASRRAAHRRAVRRS